MGLSREDFAAFYTAVNGGEATPFAWQERLLDHLLFEGWWPDRIAAPTGAGKTSAIDVHLFAVALTAGGGEVRLPRRLAMVVDRRVLVDDQYERARTLREALRRPTDAVVVEVAERLAALRWPERAPSEAESPLVVGRLRGGAAASRAWRDDPTACAVLCATPDMFGSRLLFRGYGTARRAAGREAGLLALDTAVVVDEAHLAQQLLCTARRVSELAGVADQPVGDVPVLQVVETTATPSTDGAGSEISVDEADLASPLLEARLTRPKPVTLLSLPGWPARQPTAAIAGALADAALGLYGAQEGESRADDRTTPTVGCFVNTVSMAVAVIDQLATRRIGGRAVNPVLVCGQTRPADLHRLKVRYEGLLTPRGHREVDVIVATQSLEVGVDLDLAGVVTELASGAALAQRAGRVNRRGIRSTGPVVVGVPQAGLTDRSRSGPYEADELSAALQWVTSRAADPEGMAPWRLRTEESRPPKPARRRTLFQRVELADAWHWARTSDDLAAEPELELWLADSFEEQPSVSLVVRDRMPSTADAAGALLQVLPPRSYEMFSVPLHVARSVVQELIGPVGRSGPEFDTGDVAAFPPVVRVRGEDVACIPTGAGPSLADVRPGDVVVVDSSAAIFSSGGLGFSPPVVVPVVTQEEDGLKASERRPADDVLHKVDPEEHPLVLRLEVPPLDADPKPHWWVSGVACAGEGGPVHVVADEEESLTPLGLRAAVADVIDLVLKTPGDCDSEAEPMVQAVQRLLRGSGKRARAKDSDVLAKILPDGSARVLVIDRRKAMADDELRQVFTTSEKPVTLVAHSAAVESRAELVATTVGLPTRLVAALAWAGKHHDAGKQDTRFQLRLGATEAEVLAKSDPSATVALVRKREKEADLPRSWRHEQRSVVDSWTLAQDRDGFDPDLGRRLVGTSHGEGRTSFPLATSALLPQAPDGVRDLAEELFELGGWDALIEETHVRYGVWGCAYLEALLRAADGQVSGEGT